MYNSSKAPGLTPLSDEVFSADHDKIIKIYIFLQNWGPRLHFASNNNIGGQKFQKVNIITIGVLRDPK